MATVGYTSIKKLQLRLDMITVYERMDMK